MFPQLRLCPGFGDRQSRTIIANVEFMGAFRAIDAATIPRFARRRSRIVNMAVAATQIMRNECSFVRHDGNRVCANATCEYL